MRILIKISALIESCVSHSFCGEQWVAYTTIRKRLLGLSNYKGKPQECAPLSRTKVKLDGDLVSRIFDVVTFDSKLTKGLIYNC